MDNGSLKRRASVDKERQQCEEMGAGGSHQHKCCIISVEEKSVFCRQIVAVSCWKYSGPQQTNAEMRKDKRNNFLLR